MEDLPLEKIWEHLAYLIVTQDPIGKRYMDSLRKQAPRAAESMRKALQEINHGGRKE